MRIQKFLMFGSLVSIGFKLICHRQIWKPHVCRCVPRCFGTIPFRTHSLGIEVIVLLFHSHTITAITSKLQWFVVSLFEHPGNVCALKMFTSGTNDIDSLAGPKALRERIKSFHDL